MKAKEWLNTMPSQFSPYDVDALSIENYKGIVFSGMGGSGIVGDVLKLLLERRGIGIPVISLHGYQLPPYAKRDWLLVAVSYSGNTEETLSTVQEAIQKGLNIICISSGGKLKEVADKEGFRFISVPSGYAPRYAFGFMLSAVMSLFGFGKSLENIRKNLNENKEEIKETAHSIAQVLQNYIPVVYSTPLTEPIAFRWKTQINENSKTLCYTAVLPELHHNEVVGLDNPIARNLCHFIILYDPEDHPRVIKRVEITVQIFKELGLAPLILQGKGQSLEERLMYLAYLEDWVSFYLADIYGYDPLPVKIIDRIKESLK
ncbi:bifunctional phosphoglucose/phosphomannose isomerase [Thermocrinis jamiesonii]|jgi:bifunctional phosphoglucose/phosphomannose isomerase (EC 5.3.1.8; EC 5.3.1.9)|uniref:bifunctional phosphoglucose/phosphomannose isomerase n=1 Tax=Thermocrinis jamiesonii TaxID=1302351 RepID=UPI000497EDF9|nr:bifunctional phosphoglucose/phosphomannose isomerase [Thermocrinis jamiesonii]